MYLQNEANAEHYGQTELHHPHWDQICLFTSLVTTWRLWKQEHVYLCRSIHCGSGKLTSPLSHGGSERIRQGAGGGLQSSPAWAVSVARHHSAWHFIRYSGSSAFTKSPEPEDFCIQTCGDTAKLLTSGTYFYGNTVDNTKHGGREEENWIRGSWYAWCC